MPRVRLVRSACGSVEHSRRSAAAVPHRKHLQVDYATGELDRLRVLGPIDTKLFIGRIIGLLKCDICVDSVELISAQRLANVLPTSCR